jgi:hypothetical protein
MMEVEGMPPPNAKTRPDRAPTLPTLRAASPPLFVLVLPPGRMGERQSVGSTPNGRAWLRSTGLRRSRLHPANRSPCPNSEQPSASEDSLRGLAPGAAHS